MSKIKSVTSIQQKESTLAMAQTCISSYQLQAVSITVMVNQNPAELVDTRHESSTTLTNACYVLATATPQSNAMIIE
jgi:hypothetical protein